MIKSLAALALLCLPIQSYAKPIHVVSPAANIDLKTEKVVRLKGDVNVDSMAAFIKQMNDTSALPGPVLILIDSPGGSVEAGQMMITRLEIARASRETIVCVVLHTANSMAFNLLTHCDVRLATPKATLLFHKIYYTKLPAYGDKDFKYLNGHELRERAEAIDKGDEIYRNTNIPALGMSPDDYDMHCRYDTTWKAETLVERGYLAGIATLDK